jgi:hypothetical protein
MWTPGARAAGNPRAPIETQHPENLEVRKVKQGAEMLFTRKIMSKPTDAVPSSLPGIPEKIEALRKIWKREMTDFLEALPQVRHLLEPHISQVMEKLLNITDPDELSDYCFPRPEGPRVTPIARDIDIAIHSASLELFDENPENRSQVEAFKFMRGLYEPYNNRKFENWINKYFQP